MKRIRPTARHMQNFTGLIGIVKFTDGISDDYQPQHVIDRLSAAIPMIEVDESGNEQPAGAANRIIRMSAERAPIAEILERSTDAEKEAELKTARQDRFKAPTGVFYSSDELVEIADKHGINKLREIAEPWKIKSRKITDLIKGILDAQVAYIARRDKAAGGAPVDDIPLVQPIAELQDEQSITEHTPDAELKKASEIDELDLSTSQAGSNS